MKKHLSKLLSFFLCICFFVTISNKSNAAEEIIPVNISVQYGQTEARTILDMINEMRTSSLDAWYWNMDDTTKIICDNLSKLTYNYDLERIALKRAAEIALSYSHTRPNIESCFSIYTEEGITRRTIEENITVVYPSAQTVNAAGRENDENYGGATYVLRYYSSHIRRTDRG